MVSCATGRLGLRCRCRGLTPEVRAHPGDHGAGRVRRRRDAAQPVISTARRLAAADRRGLLSLLRRPAQPAAARRRRHRRRHRDPAAAVAPGARSATRHGAIATQNRGLELALLLTLPAAIGARRRGAADPRRAVRARRVRPARSRGHGRGARRLCRRAAGLCPGQGDGAGAFSRATTRDAGQGRVRRHGGQISS